MALSLTPAELAAMPDNSWQPVPHGARVVVLPWACVMHDNHRLVAANNRRGLVASKDYRQRKESARTVAALQWKGFPVWQGDMTLTARCYFPDRRKRDAGNYRKLVTDALTGIVYADDAQLVCETWRRAGIVPKDTARIEVLVYPAASHSGVTQRETESR